MPLSSYGLCDAEITMPGVEALGARQIGDRRRRHDAGADDRRAFAAQAARQLVLDPRARFARVAADHESQRLTCGSPGDAAP